MIRNVLVTGGTKRVGKVIADHLEERGEKVYRSTREDGDLGRSDGCESVVARAAEALGGLDGVVISASIFRKTPWKDLTLADWKDFIHINFNSVLWLAYFAEKKMTAGAIVIIGDGATAHARKNYLPYNVSKAALRPLMEHLALELAPRIRVNMVSPGTILPPEGTPDETLELIKRHTPLEKIGSPQHILPAVVDCLTNDFMTGTEIRIDGGRGI